jgi:hypothetical protein
LTDQIDVAKDVAIATLSTSALLVTLLAGFTVLARAAGEVTPIVQTSAIEFIVSCASSAIALILVLSYSSTVVNHGPSGRWYKAIIAADLIGLTFLGIGLGSLEWVILQ